MNQVIMLTKQSKVLKIEDLLPSFNQNIKIESFKDEICESLKSYSEEINKLKKMMDSYSANAEQLKNELRLIKNRCIEVDSNTKCEECFKVLYKSEFYIFPCMHGFHKDCLFEAAKSQPVVNVHKLEEIGVLSDDIDQIKQKMARKQEAQKMNREAATGFSSLMTSLKNWRQGEVEPLTSERDEAEIKVKRDKIDSILASECIYCGPGIVDTLTMPFNNAALRESWKI
jgi:hypothetical protein